MSGVTKKLMGTTAAGGGFTAIEDVFSTYLYTGNGSTQTITNGIDLAGEGGLVWFKQRNGINEHQLFDTERGQNQRLLLPPTSGQVNSGTDNLVSFNSDGFTLGPNALMTGTNGSGQTMASWTFRKAPRFFDVVTYTGDGTAYRTLSHELGVRPGAIVIKRTDSTGDWFFMHRGNTTTSWFHTGSSGGNPDFGKLNTTDAFTYLGASTSACYAWIGTNDTSFEITGGDPTEFAANITGATYVAYLFAHDPLGPSGDGSDGLIACGNYTTGGSFGVNTEVNLGWEPQFILLKKASESTGAASWLLVDTMRGIPKKGEIRQLLANTSDAESAIANNPNGEYISPTATGFEGLSGDLFGLNQNVIYIAIRRGPMRAPESGTEVFATTISDGAAPAYDSPFVPDAAWTFYTPGYDDGTNAYPEFFSRLTGQYGLQSSNTRAQNDRGTAARWDYMNGFYDSTLGSLFGAWMFRRAPEFFDVVAYTGDGVAGRTVPHNLGVAPEMMVVKKRNSATNSSWICYCDKLLTPVSGNAARNFLVLNSTQAGTLSDAHFNATSPTESEFTLGTSTITNSSGDTFITYLFATLAGVSKVGSYTGNGTSQTIDCGFTSGARFVLIKRTDSTGDWYVWDTARGIVAANDPHMSLNTTAAEVTTDDSVDPDSSGFIVNQVAATNINVSAASYIFYAVA